MTPATPGVTVSLRELIALRGQTRNLQLAGRSLPSTGQSGGHLASHKGRGLEFAEVRAYQAGDDLRTIDWRVTARRGRPHTKLFREERERPVVIFADLHAGMFFGTRKQFKSVLIARLTALAAWIAAQEGDRVGGVISAGPQCTVVAARSRRAGVLHLLNAVVKLQPTAPGHNVRSYLDEHLAKVRRVVHPGSVVVLLSDFAGLGQEGQRALLALARTTTVLAGFIYDPLEAQPPTTGRYRFGSPVRQVEVDTAETQLLEAWRLSFQRRLAVIRELSRKSAISLTEISTSMEPSDFFATRSPGRTQ